MDRVLLPYGRRVWPGFPKSLFSSSNTCILDDGPSLAQRMADGTILQVRLVPASREIMDRTCRGMQDREVRYDFKSGAYVVMTCGGPMSASLPERVSVASMKIVRPSAGPARLSDQRVGIGPLASGAERLYLPAATLGRTGA